MIVDTSSLPKPKSNPINQTTGNKPLRQLYSMDANRIISWAPH